MLALPNNRVEVENCAHMEDKYFAISVTRESSYFSRYVNSVEDFVVYCAYVAGVSGRDLLAEMVVEGLYNGDADIERHRTLLAQGSVVDPTRPPPVMGSGGRAHIERVTLALSGRWREMDALGDECVHAAAIALGSEGSQACARGLSTLPWLQEIMGDDRLGLFRTLLTCGKRKMDTEYSNPSLWSRNMVELAVAYARDPAVKLGFGHAPRIRGGELPKVAKPLRVPPFPKKPTYDPLGSDTEYLAALKVFHTAEAAWRKQIADMGLNPADYGG